MRKSGGIKDILQVLVFFLLALAVAATLAAYNRIELAGAVRVIDGDSLRLENEEIRLFGIDAPEFQQQCETSSGGSYPCGKRSADYLRALLRGKEVSCLGNDRDKYERLLARCNIDGMDIAGRMVSQGWAVSFGAYSTEEQRARASGKGIWAGEFQNPANWRRDKREAHQRGGFLLGLFQ